MKIDLTPRELILQRAAHRFLVREWELVEEVVALGEGLPYSALKARQAQKHAAEASSAAQAYCDAFDILDGEVDTGRTAGMFREFFQHRTEEMRDSIDSFALQAELRDASVQAVLAQTSKDTA